MNQKNNTTLSLIKIDLVVFLFYIIFIWLYMCVGVYAYDDVLKLLKNRTTVGIACIVLSLFICFGLTPMFNKAVANKVKIVRVTKDITIGDEITSRMIQIIEVGGYNLPNDVIKSKGNVIGKYATTDMIKGDYILTSKLWDTTLCPKY